MQTFPNLRRNSTFKETLKAILLLVVFSFYTSLSDIYLFLPPMIGLLFIFYVHTSKENEWILTLSIIACLIFFEFDHSEYSGILPLVFVLTDWLIVKKFQLLFQENVLLIFVYIGLIYFVYLFILYLLGMFGGILNSNLEPIFISYIFYESCLGIVYEKIKHQI